MTQSDRRFVSIRLQLPSRINQVAIQDSIALRQGMDAIATGMRVAMYRLDHSPVRIAADHMLVDAGLLQNRIARVKAILIQHTFLIMSRPSVKKLAKYWWVLELKTPPKGICALVRSFQDQKRSVIIHREALFRAAVG